MFTLEIETGNAAFNWEDGTPAPGPEVARIIRKLAATIDRLVALPDDGEVSDINGNRVGTWSLKP